MMNNMLCDREKERNKKELFIEILWGICCILYSIVVARTMNKVIKLTFIWIDWYIFCARQIWVFISFITLLNGLYGASRWIFIITTTTMTDSTKYERFLNGTTSQLKHRNSMNGKHRKCYNWTSQSQKYKFFSLEPWEMRALELQSRYPDDVDEEHFEMLIFTSEIFELYQLNLVLPTAAVVIVFFWFSRLIVEYQTRWK